MHKIQHRHSSQLLHTARAGRGGGGVVGAQRQGQGRRVQGEVEQGQRWELRRGQRFGQGWGQR